MKKGTKLNSIVKMKCPNCQEGDFYEGSIYKANVKEKCEVCNFKYSIEPGFYQGSYYVVYALGVAVFVTIWTSISLFFPNTSWDGVLIAILVGLVATAPFMYPLSKIIWANLFFKYGQYKSNNETKTD
ncbi:MAG: DUF983 domain-containing protein [Bacteroidota bacterium]